MHLDDETKKEMLKAGAPAIAQMSVPLLQTIITSHYDNKRMEKRKEFEVDMAKHRAQKLESAASGGQQEPQPSPFDAGYDGDEPLDDAVEMADELDASLQQAKRETECGFCRDILEDLQDEPAEVQRQGLREVKELEAVRESNPSRDQLDAVMSRFEVIPKLVV